MFRACNLPCAAAAGSGTLLIYVVFYTGYDKATKSLRIKDKVPAVLRHPIKNYKEWNKVFALTALTNLGAGYVAYARKGYEDLGASLLMSGVVMAGIHGVYSAYAYFGRFQGPKMWSMLLGVAAVGTSVGAVATTPIPAEQRPLLALLSVTLATAHFWTMETKDSWLPGVRPIGWLAAVAGFAGVAAATAKLLQKQ